MLKQISYQQRHPSESRSIAYDMAGLMETDFVAALPNDDLYVEVLALVGQLELPEEHQGDVSWDELKMGVELL